MRHLLLRFMYEVDLQLKARENCGEFCNVPITLYLNGACSAFITVFSR